jgi:osmotically-inducible protein OsmY
MTEKRQPAPKRARHGAKSLAYVPDNRALQRAIEAYIPSGVLPSTETAKKKKARRPGITVEVRDGFVTLRGTVLNVRQRDRLHRFVMGLSGVRAVRNLLVVAPDESASDLVVAGYVRQSLDAHAELAPGTITVHVSDGVCRLRGNVETAEQKHVAEHVAEHCRGVKSVINHVEVNPLDRVTDRASAGAVRKALDYCAELNASKISVSCANGVVLLRGQAPTLFDRALAEELARIQGGVRAVENHIQVVVGADRRRNPPAELSGAATAAILQTRGIQRETQPPKPRIGVQAKRKLPMRD